MFCWHKYKFVGAYWHEFKVSGHNHGYVAFHLYKCEKCGKEYRNEIIKEGTTYCYEDKINNLERNGYKHINKYMTKE